MKTGVPLLLLLVICFGCANSPKVVWKYKTGSDVTYSPAISGDKLIVGSWDHYLYALDLEDGKVIWKTDLGERVFSSPLAEGDKIYVAAASGFFFQINAQDGSIGWKYDSGARISFNPCADSEAIYFGSDNGKIYKINRQGEVLWAYQTGNRLTASCVFYKDLVIAPSWDYNIHAVRRDSGEGVWKAPTGVFNYGNGAILGDSYYYGTHAKLFRIDATTGNIIYIKQVASHDRIAAYGGNIYTSELGLTKRAPDGTVINNVRYSSTESFQPNAAGNTMIGAATTNHLYGISPDFEILWKFKAKDEFRAPGVLHNGVYYIGNRDGYVYALKLPA